MKTRPLTIVKALVSGALLLYDPLVLSSFRRCWWRGFCEYTPSIWASTAPHIKHNKIRIKVRHEDSEKVIAQQRCAYCPAVGEKSGERCTGVTVSNQQRADSRGSLQVGAKAYALLTTADLPFVEAAGGVYDQWHA